MSKATTVQPLPYDYIGQKMRRARLAVAMTQEELAEELGVSQTLISRYESGADPLRADDLRRIADITERNLYFFFDEETPEEILEDLPLRRFIETHEPFDGCFQSLPRTLQAALTTIIISLAKWYGSRPVNENKPKD